MLPQQRPVPVWIRKLSQVKTEILLMVYVCIWVRLQMRQYPNPTDHTAAQVLILAKGRQQGGLSRGQLSFRLQNHTLIFREMEPTQSHMV